MKVVYNDIKPNEILEKDIECTYLDSTEAVLEQADVVSVHVPLLDSTRHLINTERLAKMKPTAYLINTSRGPVIDEAELVEALKNGVIRGAGLDVFEDEPALAPGLSELENVTITPHIASASEETRDKMSQMAAQNIIDHLSGNPPTNLIPELQN